MSVLLGAAWGAVTNGGRAAAKPAAAQVHITGPVASTASPGVRPSPATPKPPAHPALTKAADAQPAVQPVTFVTLHWGDTLFALASSHHTTVSALQQLNGLGTSTLIYAGHRLRVPAATLSSADPVPIDARLRTQPILTGTSHGPVAGKQHHGAAAAIAFAEDQLGKPYQWGGTGPSGFDCSGLVMRAWQAGGITLPRGSHDQARAGVRIHRTQLRPGDLVFTNESGHVQLYIGDGRIIEAARPGTVIRISILPPPSQVDAYVHLDTAA